MRSVLKVVASAVVSFFRSRAEMQLEILALRHQLAVCQRSVKRPRLQAADRILWAWLSKSWSAWERVLVIVQPATVVQWRRRKFREHRPVQPAKSGVVVEIPQVGGIHHRYERRAA